MLPTQLEDFSKSMAAVVVFLSNFYFLSQVGYFAPDAELQPLLHTWSLAVEEQFYLLYPPLLVLLWGRSRRVTGVFLGVVAGLSLGLAELAWHANPERNFYFTGTRVWELLAGALAALALHRRTVAPHQGAAVIGAGLIVAAILFFGRATPFPSLWTLVPVVGAVLVILFARPQTVVGKILGGRAFVGIGLVSYSAYPWHHPLFAIARLRFVAEPPFWVMVALVAVTFGLAVATWAYVEQPVRRRERPFLVRPAAVFGASAVGGVAIFTLAVFGVRTDGFELAWRGAFPVKAGVLDAIRTAEINAHLPQDDGACRFNVEVVDAAVAERLARCQGLHGAGIAVMGDSHAIDLFGIVSAQADRPFVAGFTKPACRPVMTTDRECPYNSALEYIAAFPDVFDLVLFEMSGAYLLMLDGRAGVQNQIERLPLSTAAPSLELARDNITATANWITDLSQSVPIVWFGPRVEPQVQLQWLVGRGCDQGLVLRENTEAPYVQLDDTLAQLAQHGGFAYVSQIKAFDLMFPRDLGGCDGLLWSDGDHYSALGEAMMADRADPVALGIDALLAR